MIYWWANGCSWSVDLDVEGGSLLVRYFKHSLSEDENESSLPYEEDTDTVRLCT